MAPWRFLREGRSWLGCLGAAAAGALLVAPPAGAHDETGLAVAGLVVALLALATAVFAVVRGRKPAAG